MQRAVQAMRLLCINLPKLLGMVEHLGSPCPEGKDEFYVNLKPVLVLEGIGI